MTERRATVGARQRWRRRFPAIEFPEDAARAVALAARYGRWRSRPDGEVLRPDPADVERGAAIISRELAPERGWMSPAAVSELLDCYGVPQVRGRLERDTPGAVAAAAELGWPVALKGFAPGLLHKRDVGAVATELATPAQVRDAADRIRTSVSAAGFELDGYLVQPMIEGGVELIGRRGS